MLYNMDMKILAIADTNPQLDYPQFVAEHAIDIVMTLGDLDRSQLIGLERVTTPKIGVYGNHCSGTYMNEFGIVNMHLNAWQWRGVSFGGFQGCVRYKENPDAIMYTQQEARELLASMPPVDVFLTHCPPRGINDEEELAHQGFDGLRTYIERTPPKLLLHGHTYPAEATMVRQFGLTRIEYVHKYKVIDIDLGEA